MPFRTLLDARYRILRTIGSGGMGVVYLVTDVYKENKIMALKTCDSGHDICAAEGFRSEFRSILGVKHPHIPEVFDFGSLKRDESKLYFTSEFINGQPLDSLLDHWNPEQLREVLVCLCRALAFLHSRSLLHRDIKPANILGRLQADGKFSLLKLVDFGLASSGASPLEEISGTLDYLSPEVIRGEAPTGASDIYSLGLLLYRLATRTLPNSDQDPMIAARIRSRTEVASPLRYRADLPVGLADVISAMVRLNPSDRPQSPRHVIALLNEREGSEFPYETVESSSAYIRSAALVTNANVRRLLTVSKQELLAGETPKSIFIRSQAGMGRRRLFQDFMSELTLAGAAIRVVNQESDLTYDEDGSITTFIPEIAALDVNKLIRTYDDLPRKPRWWIIGGAEIPAAIQDRLERVRVLNLFPLDEKGVGEFIQATFPDNSFPESFRIRLHTETMGVPSALQAVFDDLQQQGLLRIGLTGWELLPGNWNPTIHDDVRSLIAGEIKQLSTEALRELHMLACSQSPLPDSVLNHAMSAGAQADESKSIGRLPLASTGWIARSDGASSIRFSAIRQVVSEQMDDRSARSLHGLLCEAWLSAPDIEAGQRDQEALYHDFKGKSWSTPVDEAERILTDAIKNDQLHWIGELLNWCLNADPPEMHNRIIRSALSRVEFIGGNLPRSAELLGDILDQGKAEVTPENLSYMARFAFLEEKLGRTGNAEQILTKTLPLLSTERNSVMGSVYGTMAWIAFKKGEQERANALAEQGLTRVPHDAADAGFALLLNTFATLSFYKGDGEVAAVYWQRCLEVSKTLGDRKSISTMYNNLGVLAAQSGDRIRARNLWEQCAEIAREINDIQRLAGIYNNLGVDALETGSMREAEEYYVKSLTLFRRMQSPREQVELLSNLGELSYYRADYPRAQAYLNEAVELAIQLGDRESQIEPMVYLGKLLISLDHLERAESVLKDVQSIAHEAGIRKGEGQALEGLAVIYARRGMMKTVHEALENAHKLLPNDADPLAAIHLHLTECRLAAENGKHQIAIAALGNARHVADTKWDPFTAARTEVYGLLFAHEVLDEARCNLALRKLSLFPEFLWRFHWAEARKYANDKAFKKALEEFGKGVAVLKAISARLSEADSDAYLNAPAIRQFKSEALQTRKALKAD